MRPVRMSRAAFKNAIRGAQKLGLVNGRRAKNGKPQKAMLGFGPEHRVRGKFTSEAKLIYAAYEDAYNLARLGIA